MVRVDLSQVALMDQFDQAMLAEARAVKRKVDAGIRFVDQSLLMKYGPRVPPETPSSQSADPPPYVDGNYTAE